MRVRPDRIEAVLFDMDGTLVDSDAAVERAWLAWARWFGVAGAKVLALAHGSPSERTVRRVAPWLDDHQVTAAAQHQLDLQYTDLHDVGAAPGAHDALAVLAARRLPWGVVTSADRRLAGLRLAAAGIEPPLLVTVEDTARGKPHPDGYLKAAAALGADPVGCLVVEDSEPGIAAGRAAGMPVAALRGLPADLPIADLRALAGWLDGAR
ncbi:MAG: alpha-glucosidase [Streptosporangiaceae bacterium]|jgi:HAD superfamily hydrolase (TIGR01509 family)|nr:HAD-superfamily hydrolase, subfamily variant 3 [Streptosporangiaceae bacterium]MDX6428194.1 alpha-glucosidase [Streptosporangiaceae bacterium]